MSEQTTFPVDNHPFDTLASCDAKLSVILLSMNYCQERIGKYEMNVFAILLDEMRRSLVNITSYFQEADTVMSPLKRHLKDVHPESPDLLEWLLLFGLAGHLRLVACVHPGVGDPLVLERAKAGLVFIPLLGGYHRQLPRSSDVSFASPPP